MLVHGLGTIEKYGTRLLTTAVEHLPQGWQYIDFTKASVKTKLGDMKVCAFFSLHKTRGVEMKGIQNMIGE